MTATVPIVSKRSQLHRWVSLLVLFGPTLPAGRPALAQNEDPACEVLVRRIADEIRVSPVGRLTAGPYLRFPDPVFGEVGVSCPPAPSVQVNWDGEAPTARAFDEVASWGSAVTGKPLEAIGRTVRAACAAASGQSRTAPTARRSNVGYEVLCTAGRVGAPWKIEITRSSDAD